MHVTVTVTDQTVLETLTAYSMSRTKWQDILQQREEDKSSWQCHIYGTLYELSAVGLYNVIATSLIPTPL
jgi:hypothetical protein